MRSLSSISVAAALLGALAVGNACDSYTFDSSPGSFTDGSGSSNYRNNKDCAWKLRCPSGQNVRLSFSSFDTERNYDHLTLYDGETTSSTQLARLSGTGSPSSTTARLTSTGRYMRVRFTTDGSVAGSGWSASWSCTSSSSSGSGTCSTTADLGSNGCCSNGRCPSSCSGQSVSNSWINGRSTSTCSCTGCAGSSSSSSSSYSRTTCSRGQYLSGGSCRSCGAGTYQSSSSHTRSSCSTCASGKYQSRTGQSSCITCAAGQRDYSSRMTCITCSAGKQDTSSRTSCTTCSAGTYSRSDRTSCSSCPSGKTSAAGSDSSSDCYSTGSYSSSSSSYSRAASGARDAADHYRGEAEDIADEVIEAVQDALGLTLEQVQDELDERAGCNAFEQASCRLVVGFGNIGIPLVQCECELTGAGIAAIIGIVVAAIAFIVGVGFGIKKHMDTNKKVPYTTHTAQPQMGKIVQQPQVQIVQQPQMGQIVDAKDEEAGVKIAVAIPDDIESAREDKQLTRVRQLSQSLSRQASAGAEAIKTKCMELQADRRARVPSLVPLLAEAEHPHGNMMAGRLSTMGVDDVLTDAKLSHFADAIEKAGAVDGRDLADMDDASLKELGMKDVEIKRLRRQLAKAEQMAQPQMGQIVQPPPVQIVQQPQMAQMGKIVQPQTGKIVDAKDEAAGVNTAEIAVAIPTVATVQTQAQVTSPGSSAAENAAGTDERRAAEV
eukprot:COSAG04_NODE_2736_length_3656_cov_2.037672_3_plen_718_part_00